ncbi:hypothetical protein KIN20_037947 [Parelaphostrongylus tenuis]|uniref:Uncharacterized protein n=1 Tax=Parelaphostrongylus tenuis TaxID=148309 RepID=A0AAD5RE72_PARTN|nr:hypothetical protein KIN20_037947 [Parelaphostrongylus tenuis]
MFRIAPNVCTGREHKEISGERVTSRSETPLFAYLRENFSSPNYLFLYYRERDVDLRVGSPIDVDGRSGQLCLQPQQLQVVSTASSALLPTAAPIRTHGLTDKEDRRKFKTRSIIPVKRYFQKNGHKVGINGTYDYE